MAVPADSTILAVQTEAGLEDLAAEDDEGFSTDTVVALEQYASKVSSQSLTAHHQLSYPGQNCQLFRGQDHQCWGMAWATPLAPTPYSWLVFHILIQDMHPALPVLPTAVYTHPCLCCLYEGGSCE